MPVNSFFSSSPLISLYLMGKILCKFVHACIWKFIKLFFSTFFKVVFPQAVPLSLSFAHKTSDELFIYYYLVSQSLSRQKMKERMKLKATIKSGFDWMYCNWFFNDSLHVPLSLSLTHLVAGIHCTHLRLAMCISLIE